MFFGSYKSKVEEVISINFRDGNQKPYRVAGHSQKVLDQIISLIKSKGGNHHDAAILFMISQAEAMNGNLSQEMRKWKESTMKRALALTTTNGKIARQFINELPPATNESSEILDGSSVLIRSLMEAAGVFVKPALFCKPQVLCYLYGWCDATLQKMASDKIDGTTSMLMMFCKIYEPLREHTSLDSDEIAAKNLRTAIELVKSGDFVQWVQLGGEDFYNLIDANDFNFNLQAAVEA